jgi:hypothetical protein
MDISDIATTYLRRGLLKETKDGRFKIVNITRFEIASKELEKDSDEDILAKIPQNVTDRYSGLLGKQTK